MPCGLQTAHDGLLVRVIAMKVVHEHGGPGCGVGKAQRLGKLPPSLIYQAGLVMVLSNVDSTNEHSYLLFADSPNSALQTTASFGIR